MVFSLPKPLWKEDEEEEKFVLPEPTLKPFVLPEPTTRGEYIQSQPQKFVLPKPTISGEPIQDIQMITAPPVEAPEKEPYPGVAGRTVAKVYSKVVERGLVTAFNTLTGFKVSYPVTEKVRQQEAWERKMAKDEGFFQEIAAELEPALEDLGGMLIQTGAIRVLFGLGAMATVLGTKPSIFKTLAPLATQRLLTIEGTPVEKAQGALFSIAASITPFIINSTGATGFGAMACDTMLNMLLSNKTYTDALSQSDNPTDFLKSIIPQLVIDIGMAWNTRGSNEMQIRIAYEKYEKQAERTLKLKLHEFTDLVKLAKKTESKLKLEEAKKGTVLEQANIIDIHKQKIAQEKSKITKLKKAIRTGKLDGEPISKEAMRAYKDDLIAAQKNMEDYTKQLDTAIKRETELKVGEITKAEKGQALLDIDKEAEIYIEDYSAIQMLKSKIQSTFGVQDVLKQVGAPETGFNLKNYPGMVAYGHDKGIIVIRDIMKIARKANISKHDVGTFADITYAVESGKYREGMDKETLTKYQPMIDLVNKFYKEYEGRLKEIGWMEVPFPQSLINRNEARIKELQDQIKDAKGSQEIMMRKEINELRATNGKISEENLSFVSVPIRMIMKDMDAAVTKHFMSILPKWGRKTITIRDLVEEGVITEKEADIRTILGEYTNRMAKKYALGLVFKSAREEELIKSASQQPNWETFDEKIVPQLKGQRIHPMFNNLLTAYFGAASAKVSNWQQMVGITKMMQFYNPLFLPMYDIVQAAAAGSVLTLKAPIYFVKGVKDVLTKSENYWEAFRNGIFSKPFYLKEDEFTARLNKHIEPSTIKRLAKGAIPAVYTLSWNTAWTLDAMVRMATYNYFKDTGMSSREAGQTAAMFHGDYASLPPDTRKKLNTLLFTPTFKIVMAKLGTDMIKGAAKTAFDYTGATKTDKAYAKGLVRSFAILTGVEMVMESLGYETEEKYRKYKKEVMTDEGLKESVITFSHPLNLLWRYWYRGKKVFEPDVQNKFDKFCEQAEYELTPIYNIALRIRRNAYEEVYNPNDNGDKILKDVVKYSIGEIVAISKLAFETEAKKSERAKHYKVLVEQIGELEAAFITPFVYHYTRDVHDVRLRRRIQTFKKINAGILDYKEGVDIDTQLKQYDNYIKKLEALYEQF